MVPHKISAATRAGDRSAQQWQGKVILSGFIILLQGALMWALPRNMEFPERSSGAQKRTLS